LSKRALTKLRGELRSIDSELLDTLARRIRLVRRIGLLKEELQMEVIDTDAEKSVMSNFIISAARAGVEEAYARRLAELLIGISVDAQVRSRPRAISGDSLLKRLSETMLTAEKEGRKLIRLDIGEPRFKTPSAAIREAKRYLGETSTILYGSSAGLSELKEVIAARLNAQYGTRLRQSNILIFPGARFAIFAAMRSTLSSLDRVVVCQPAWTAYESSANLAGARVRSVMTTLEDRWDINLSRLEEELSARPRMLVLNNPSNPTGKVLSENMFREVVELAKRNRTVVLSDEVYASYCDSRVPSVLQYPDCEWIYVNSFSKEFSMTGWRIAYAVADEKRIAKMRSIVQTTLTNIPELVQRAALAALKDTSGEAPRARRGIAKRVAMACEQLSKAELEFYPPDGGFYVFPRIGRGKVDSGKFAELLLAGHGVGVLPGTAFGGYREFLRLAITEPETRVKIGIKRIVKAMHEWRQ